MVSKDQIEQKIAAALPGSAVNARDLTGGGDHWQVSVKAEQFRGLGLVQQHQMVYKALGEWMRREIHALALDTSEL